MEEKELNFTENYNMPSAPLSDCRKLKAVYFCGVEEKNLSMESCIFFSPSANGDCTFRDRGFLESICRKDGEEV